VINPKYARFDFRIWIGFLKKIVGSDLDLKNVNPFISENDPK